MNGMQMLKIVEQFSRKGHTDDENVKIIRVPDRKTVFVEQIGEIGRSILFDEYKVDGKIYWAGYSSRSQSVFVSQAA
jgi:hypothetical protein